MTRRTPQVPAPWSPHGRQTVTSWELVIGSGDTREVIDTAEDQSTADYLLREYRLAYGPHGPAVRLEAVTL